MKTLTEHGDGVFASLRRQLLLHAASLAACCRLVALRVLSSSAGLRRPGPRFPTNTPSHVQVCHVTARACGTPPDPERPGPVGVQILCDIKYIQANPLFRFRCGFNGVPWRSERDIHLCWGKKALIPSPFAARAQLMS